MSLAGNGRRGTPEHAPGFSGVPNMTAVADRESATSVAGPAVRLTDVTKVYGQGTRAVLALDKVSLSVAPGEFTCIIGASGCGKSTLLNLVAGLDQISSGDLATAGKVTLMFQELALRARGVPKAERRPRALELLETVHLGGFASKRPHELSGGMRQRVAMARALDAMTRDLMHDELERICAERTLTVLFVTHNVREAARLGDRVVVMSSRHGKVIEEYQVPRKGPRRMDSPEVAKLAATLTDRLREEMGRHVR